MAFTGYTPYCLKCNLKTTTTTTGFFLDWWKTCRQNFKQSSVRLLMMHRSVIFYFLSKVVYASIKTSLYAANVHLTLPTWWLSKVYHFEKRYRFMGAGGTPSKKDKKINQGENDFISFLKLFCSTFCGHFVKRLFARSLPKWYVLNWNF